MKLYPEHKASLKCYAALFLVFGLILLLCGALFENGMTELADHQETMYRQDQVHYWAGIPVSLPNIWTCLEFYWFILHALVDIAEASSCIN